MERKKIPDSVSNNLMLCSGLVAVVLCIISLNTNSYWFSVCAWTVPSIFLLISARQDSGLISSIFSNKLISKMGSISFEFFLIHQLCIRYLSFIFSHLDVSINMFTQAFLNFVISIIAVTIWRFIWRKVKPVFKGK